MKPLCNEVGQLQKNDCFVYRNNIYYMCGRSIRTVDGNIYYIVKNVDGEVLISQHTKVELVKQPQELNEEEKLCTMSGRIVSEPKPGRFYRYSKLKEK